MLTWSPAPENNALAELFWLCSIHFCFKEDLHYRFIQAYGLTVVAYIVYCFLFAFCVCDFFFILYFFK